MSRTRPDGRKRPGAVVPDSFRPHSQMYGAPSNPRTGIIDVGSGFIPGIPAHIWFRKHRYNDNEEHEMKNGMFSVLVGAGIALVATVAFAAEPTQVEKVQAAL